MFEFAALPPEVNSARLEAGPGPAPMAATAAAYGALAEALQLAAAASDGSMSEMAAAWQGNSANQAQQAFRQHAAWLREHAAVAGQVAGLAAKSAEAYTAALATMPPLPVVLANQAATVTLVATNGMGQNTPAIAANEAVYLGMWTLAAVTMYRYEAETMSTLATLPPPSIPPPIINGTELASPQTSGAGDSAAGTGVPGSTAHSMSALSMSPGGSAETSATDRIASLLAQLVTGVGPTPSMDVGQSATVPTVTPADPGSNAAAVDQPGFLGTAIASPTLAGLDGGIGSSVPLTLIRGGFGAMPGTATGFRMPANWNLGGERAFGAGTDSGSAAADSAQPVPMGPAPPPGIIAPADRMRRRNERDEQPAAVFVPGADWEVPTLGQAPTLGVLEYDDVFEGPGSDQ